MEKSALISLGSNMPYYTKNPPTFEFERQLWQQGCAHVVGIDEVGRGALAGPVVIGAVCFDQSHVPIVGVHDSKLLSAKQREDVVEKIKAAANCWQIGQASVEEIDRFGIVPATMMAITRALQKFSTLDHILMDGKPFTSKNIAMMRQWPTPPFSYIVKGDQLSYSIAAASIVAKVFRDQLMRELALTHSHYSWEKNVGYGTKKHLQSIRKFGLTPQHRLAFCH